MTSPPRFHFLFFLLLATLCALTHASDKPPPNIPDDLNVDDLFGNNKSQVCPAFTCPKPYVPLAKWPLGITSTGCQLSSGMAFSASGMDYKHIDHCCDIKNACYQLCGSNKQTCDSEMEKCMEESCKELPDSAAMLNSMSEDEIKKEQEECGKMKSLILLLGNMGGCSERDAQQRRSCECIEKDKVGEKMERLLRNFYKKYNPEAMDKVEGLLKKVDGKRSLFNHILYSLVKKYPASIKKKVAEVPDPSKMDL